MIKNTRKNKTTVSSQAGRALSPKAPGPSRLGEAAPPKTQALQAAVSKPAAPRVEAPKSASVSAPTPTHVCLEFLQPGAKTVCVAGSFNEWKPEKAPLVQKGEGLWVGDLAVPPGRHEYLFVVDGQWLPDPKANETVQNPFGGRNCVLTVAA